MLIVIGIKYNETNGDLPCVEYLENEEQLDEFRNLLDEHMKVFNDSREELKKIELVGSIICRCIRNGGKVLIAGNGGSAADAQHFAAELTGRFETDRSGLSAIALTTDTSAITAIANDYGYENIFTRQLTALGNKDDIFIGISTSGKSPSIINTLNAARDNEMTTILMTGLLGKSEIADYLITAPSKKTAFIQEFHIFALHCLCRLVDEEFLK